jgi:hypothetical protein
MAKRYQRGNQNPYIEEELTTQWPKDTKGVIRISISNTDSDYPFGIFWPLCCQFFFDIQILITTLVSFGHCVVSSSSIYRFWLPLWYLLAIVLSVLLRYTDSDYPFGIFWPLCCQFFFDIRNLNGRRTDNTMAKRYQRGNQNLYIEEELTT